jgi:hypothetical protein
VIAALRDEFELRLEQHGMSNGNFMLVTPDEMRRWRDDLTAALAPDDVLPMPAWATRPIPPEWKGAREVPDEVRIDAVPVRDDELAGFNPQAAIEVIRSFQEQDDREAQAEDQARHESPPPIRRWDGFPDEDDPDDEPAEDAR